MLRRQMVVGNEAAINSRPPTRQNWQSALLTLAMSTQSIGIPIRRSARLYNGMMQTSSAIIVTVKSSMEYADLCISMRLGNVRYSAKSLWFLVYGR